MTNIAVCHEGLHQIARQANWMESHGNILGSDRLRTLLESHNCCLRCGTRQIWDARSDLWQCPSCYFLE